MLTWLTAKSLLGAPRWLLGALVALALVWGTTALLSALSGHERAQREAGAAEQRAGDLEVTIKRTELGNETRDQLRNPGSRARYDECLLSARTPANCQRFLPQ